MCGRYNITDDPSTRALMDLLGIPFHLTDRYNVAPTEPVPVVFNEQFTSAGAGVRQIRDMRWWLTPSWAPELSTKYSMFNARAETLETSRAFKGPFRHHRGIMPAQSFIEWKTPEGAVKSANANTKKIPYLVKPDNGRIAFAAIWDTWEKQDAYIESCSLITTAAVPELQWLHHRMPVMLADDELDIWLDMQTPVAELKAMLRPRLIGEWSALPLDQAVNNARHKQKDLFDIAVSGGSATDVDAHSGFSETDALTNGSGVVRLRHQNRKEI